MKPRELLFIADDDIKQNCVQIFEVRISINIVMKRTSRWWWWKHSSDVGCFSCWWRNVFASFRMANYRSTEVRLRTTPCTKRTYLVWCSISFGNSTYSAWYPWTEVSSRINNQNQSPYQCTPVRPISDGVMLRYASGCSKTNESVYALSCRGTTRRPLRSHDCSFKKKWPHERHCEISCCYK